MTANARPTYRLTAARREPNTSLCPQLRAATSDGNYPIVGYCVLEVPPGHLIVTTIEEYRTWCTTWQFRACRWFRNLALVAARDAA